MALPGKQPEIDWIGPAYMVLGYLLGGLSALAVFALAWLYCVSEYGFLIGVSLGWIPAGIVSGLTFWVVRFGWPLILCLAGYAYTASI